MNNLINKVTVKVTLKSQTNCSFLTIYRNILINKVSVKVTQKLRKNCSFCDFIVTNTLVTALNISIYLVTLRYIRKPVLLSQFVRFASI